MSERFNSKKFVFHETFTNINGKSSGSGFIGVMLGLVAAAAIIALVVGYFLQLPNTVEVLGKILELVGFVIVLLGVRKISGNFSKTNGVEKENNESGKGSSTINNDIILETPKKG